ncbi:MAG: DEAD/DEAH box helicase [Streptosporangiales bacterium]|nr:DEAD/DEAH box helicase [Streptosporangiales bacterium]MBO0891672.1 DEAD/DEAH box helicase [Acidothermales bacterium]
MLDTAATSSRTDRRPLRQWQAAALDAYEAGAGKDFLVTATPGAGKTAFALALATRLLGERRADRVIVVCPTDHLRTQWADAAASVGVALDPTLSNSVGPVRTDTQGYVTTYAQVASAPMLHRARTDNKRSLVVLDEIHHAGDGLSWGDAVAEAFGPAVRRLALTGTPFRTRVDERIPFVRYEEDGDGALTSVADFGYGYREALADGVVRPVVFAAYTGVSRWRNSAGEVVAASLTEAGTRRTEEAAWRTALNPRGRWVPHVIAAMDDRITHLREHGMPDAAGLVLASDQQHARAYAKIVEKVTGEKPELVLSDDARANQRIREFATSRRRIVVCVRMISEGVDIPRAACLAWMTSYRTPLFFAQAIGRVVRARRPGESATVFLPAVRPLLALAAELETERNHVLPPPDPGCDDLDALPPPERSEPGEEYEALDAEAEFAHVLHRGRAVTAEALELTEDDEEFLGLPGLLSPEQTAVLLSRRDQELRRRTGTPTDSSGAEPAAWEQAVVLRREVNALVARVAARTGEPHATVHVRLRTAVPGPPSATAPLDVLAARRDHLLAEL